MSNSVELIPQRGDGRADWQTDKKCQIDNTVVILTCDN